MIKLFITRIVAVKPGQLFTHAVSA
jgi:hypothetical protein